MQTNLLQTVPAAPLTDRRAVPLFLQKSRKFLISFFKTSVSGFGFSDRNHRWLESVSLDFRPTESRRRKWRRLRRPSSCRPGPSKKPVEVVKLFFKLVKLGRQTQSTTTLSITAFIIITFSTIILNITVNVKRSYAGFGLYGVAFLCW
jgi:hypothetical protein